LGMKAAMSAEAAELAVRTRISSGSTQRAGMGLCFGWGEHKKKKKMAKNHLLFY
jgi:hypothetical protein